MVSSAYASLCGQRPRVASCCVPRIGDVRGLCAFSVSIAPPPPLQFLQVARTLWRPFDTLVQLPDFLLKAIFEQLTFSPLELAKVRLQRLATWRQWAAELKLEEDLARAKMHPNVRKVLGLKRTVLLERVAESIGWPDRQLFEELRSGFRLVGNATQSNVFRPGVTVATLSEEELMERSQYLRPAILSRVAEEPEGPHSRQLIEITRKEATEKGWLDGPHSIQDIFADYPVWMPVRRFGVLQKEKLRPIDDFKENRVNEAHSCTERVVLQAMDHVLWSLSILARFCRDGGVVDFTLSTGERMTAPVHPQWKQSGANLRVTSLDLRSAYKQLPLHPKDYDKSVVCVKCPDSSAVECYSMILYAYTPLWRFIKRAQLLACERPLACCGLQSWRELGILSNRITCAQRSFFLGRVQGYAVSFWVPVR